MITPVDSAPLASRKRDSMDAELEASSVESGDELAPSLLRAPVADKFAKAGGGKRVAAPRLEASATEAVRPGQPQPKQAQPKQAQAQPKQAQPKQAQPKQAQPKQAQAQPKQAPKQAQPKQPQQRRRSRLEAEMHAAGAGEYAEKLGAKLAASPRAERGGEKRRRSSGARELQSASPLTAAVEQDASDVKLFNFCWNVLRIEEGWTHGNGVGLHSFSYMPPKDCAIMPEGTLCGEAALVEWVKTAREDLMVRYIKEMAAERAAQAVKLERTGCDWQDYSHLLYDAQSTQGGAAEERGRAAGEADRSAPRRRGSSAVSACSGRGRSMERSSAGAGHAQARRGSSTGSAASLSSARVHASTSPPQPLRLSSAASLSDNDRRRLCKLWPVIKTASLPGTEGRYRFVRGKGAASYHYLAPGASAKEPKMQVDTFTTEHEIVLHFMEAQGLDLATFERAHRIVSEKTVDLETALAHVRAAAAESSEEDEDEDEDEDDEAEDEAVVKAETKRSIEGKRKSKDEDEVDIDADEDLDSQRDKGRMRELWTFLRKLGYKYTHDPNPLGSWIYHYGGFGKGELIMGVNMFSNEEEIVRYHIELMGLSVAKLEKQKMLFGDEELEALRAATTEAFERRLRTSATSKVSATSHGGFSTADDRHAGEPAVLAVSPEKQPPPPSQQHQHQQHQLQHQQARRRREQRQQAQEVQDGERATIDSDDDAGQENIFAVCNVDAITGKARASGKVFCAPPPTTSPAARAAPPSRLVAQAWRGARDAPASVPAASAAAGAAPRFAAACEAGDSGASATARMAAKDALCRSLETDFVGRGKEIADLSDLLTKCMVRGGRSRAILVQGDSSAGKTSLVAAALERAGAPAATVNCGICYAPNVLFETALAQLELLPRSSCWAASLQAEDVDEDEDEGDGQEEEEEEKDRDYAEARLRNLRENEAFLEALDHALPASSTSSSSSSRSAGASAAKAAKAATGQQQPARCDRIKTFAQQLQRRLSARGDGAVGDCCFLVLDNADKLHRTHPLLLQGLLRLRELPGLERLSLLLLCCEVPASLERLIGLGAISTLTLPPLSDTDCTVILARSLRVNGAASSPDPTVFARFVISTFFKKVRDVRELKRIAADLWSYYHRHCAAVSAPGATSGGGGGDEEHSGSRLQIVLKPRVQLALRKLFRHDFQEDPEQDRAPAAAAAAAASASASASAALAAAGETAADVADEERRELLASTEMPFNTRVLLVAAFLASHNSPEQDRKLFGSARGPLGARNRVAAACAGGARRKSGGAGKKAGPDAVPQLLQGPRRFHMERLFWLYRALLATLDSDEAAAKSFNEDMYDHLVSLMSAGLVVRVSPEENLSKVICKCVAPVDCVVALASTLGAHFELRDYMEVV